jgi:hypothetical protein
MTTLRPVSSAVATQLARRITQPGFLIRIGFPQALYLSTRGNITWNDVLWEAWDVEVSGFDTSGARSATSGRLALIDTDDQVLAKLILNVGASERPVTIWQITSDAPAADDPVFWFSGVIDELDIDVAAGKISLSCLTPFAATFSPRFYVSAETGFANVPPNGTVIWWGDDKITLTRGQR